MASRVHTCTTFIRSIRQTPVPACFVLHPNRERESSLAEFSGFKQFMLLKVDNGKEEEEGVDLSRNSLGYTQFITHTVWAHKTDFEVWRRRCDRSTL